MAPSNDRRSLPAKAALLAGLGVTVLVVAVRLLHDDGVEATEVPPTATVETVEARPPEFRTGADDSPTESRPLVLAPELPAPVVPQPAPTRERWLDILVSDASGTPITDARVENADPSEDEVLGITDAAGHASLPVAAIVSTRRGSYLLKVAAAGYATQVAEIPRWLSAATVELREERRVRVRVSDDFGNVLPQTAVTVSILLSAPAKWLATESRLTADDGEASVSLPQADRIRIGLSRAGFGETSSILEVAALGEIVELQLDAARVVIVDVVTASGERLDGLGIKATDVRTGRTFRTSTTHGSARIDVVPSSCTTARVECNDPAYLAPSVSVQWADDQVEARATLVVESAVQAMVEVRDEAGRPIDGTLHVCYQVPGSPVPREVDHPIVAGSSGPVGALPAGQPVDFFVSEHGATTFAELDVAIAEPLVRLVVPRRFAVRARLEGAADSEACGVLELTDEGPPAGWRIAPFGIGAQPTTLVFQAVLCPETTLFVPAGRYSVRFEGYSGATSDGHLVVEEDLDFVVTLASGSQTTLRVVDDQASPLPGVSLCVVNGRDVVECVTSPDGSCPVSVPNPGIESLVHGVDPAGVEIFLGSHALPPGGELTVVWPRVRVEGFVAVFSDGRPAGPGLVTIGPAEQGGGEFLRHGARGGFHHKATVGANGRFETGLSLHRWTVRAQVPGYADGVVDADLSDGRPAAVKLWVYEPAFVSWEAEEGADLSVTAKAIGAGGEWTRTVSVPRGAGLVGIGEFVPAGRVTFSARDENGSVVEGSVVLEAGNSYVIDREVIASQATIQPTGPGG